MWPLFASVSEPKNLKIRCCCRVTRLEGLPRLRTRRGAKVHSHDMMAIAYLLAEPSIVVKAITVLADGWSNQWSGVVNAMRLTQYFGQPDIPVAYSPKYNPDTQLNLQEPNGLPKISLLPGINNYLSEFVPLPFNERPPSWQYASTLIFTTLFRSRCKVDIIALGPLTNLAQVIQERPTIFYKKVKRLYFSGGDVVPRDAAPTTKVWPFFRGWHLYRQSVRHFLECLQ